MSESPFAEMKRYVRFTDDDSRQLAAFGRHAAPHFPRIAEVFYDRVREHERAHAVFTGEDQIVRLRQSLVRWMERLCNGPHDDDYYDERRQIGRVHVRIGLPQRYMFTGMGVLRGELLQLADALPGEQAAAVRGALARLLDLELAIMVEAYSEDLLVRVGRVQSLERDRLERALARSEHRYLNAVELAHVLVVGVDAQGRISLFNREAERVSERGREDALGRDFVELLMPEELHAEARARLASTRERVGGAGAGEEPWEASVLTRSGKLRTVQWQLAYVPHGTDEEVVLFAIGQDVTDARALHERTLRTEKLAAVGTLAAGLAHEIRNPLNGALLHVTFLERALKRAPEGGDAEALSAVQFVGDEIRRLSALVKDFLVFARPTPPQLKPTSLWAACRRIVELVGAEAAGAGAEVRTDLGTSEPVLNLDSQKVEQALLNLARNAIEALGPAGGGRVTLRVRRLPRGASIEVEDDGPGLPSPDAPVFDAFYSTKPHGTGLGLAIVHRVVTDHRGSIEVESRPGRTIFRMVLPMTGIEEAT